MVLIFAVAMVFVAPTTPEGEPRSFLDAMWTTFMRTLDPGTLAGDTGPAPLLAVLLAVTIGGIFLLSALIGVLTTGLEARLEELRQGRSLVVEQDHTVILGWSHEVFTIVSELVIANENKRRSCIAILADRDKVEMEEEIRSRVGATGRTRVVCRSGDPMDPVAIELVNPQQARAIIVVASAEEDPDLQVIKTLLAVTNSPRKRGRRRHHIVAGVHDPANLEVARLASNGEARVLDIGNFASRILVQTSRQSGLSVVYADLLDFAGDEIYFHEEPALVGRSFGAALSAYRTSSVIGVQRADGRVLLNPPAGTVLEAGDKVVAIAEDDDTIAMDEHPQAVVEEAIVASRPGVARPERTLLLGWNRRGPSIVQELDHYVPALSSIDVVAHVAHVEAEVARACDALANLRVQVTQDDTTSRAVLESLDVVSYDHIMVLCYSDELDERRADAKTLMTLLHLRDMQMRSGRRYAVVSEMLEDKSRELAEVTQADDFIVSNKLISMLLTQISENEYLHAVFSDLFSPEGSEIYLKPAGMYVQPGHPVDFYTVVEAARRRDEAAVGYRLHAHATDSSRSYGVVLNPDKAQPLTLGPRDRVIVLAED